MTPYEMSELREKQEAARNEQRLEAKAREVMPVIAKIYKERGMKVPGPRELLQQAREATKFHDEQFQEEIQAAVQAAVGRPPQPVGTSSAEEFVGSQIEREATLAKLEAIFGAEIEADAGAIRRMAVAFLDWSIWSKQATDAAGIGLTGRSAFESVVRIASEMQGEWSDIDPEKFADGFREKMGLPPESDAPLN
jgi:hypothetical protein